MQPIKVLQNWLLNNANKDHYLFLFQDFRTLFPQLSHGAYKALLSRAVKSGYLARVCRGLYTYKKVIPSTGYFLFQVAALLRTTEFNYISLETVLSDAGVISQVLMNWITLRSSGRSVIIKCGSFGTIEFVHTDQKPTDVMADLYYDKLCGLWRATVALAIKDMKRTQRNCDLIDWDVVDELI